MYANVKGVFYTVSALPPAFTHLTCSHHQHHNFLFHGNTTHGSWFNTEWNFYMCMCTSINVLYIYKAFYKARIIITYNVYISFYSFFNITEAWVWGVFVSLWSTWHAYCHFSWNSWGIQQCVYLREQKWLDGRCRGSHSLWYISVRYIRWAAIISVPTEFKLFTSACWHELVRELVPPHHSPCTKRPWLAPFTTSLTVYRKTRNWDSPNSDLNRSFNFPAWFPPGKTGPHFWLCTTTLQNCSSS